MMGSGRVFAAVRQMMMAALLMVCLSMEARGDPAETVGVSWEGRGRAGGGVAGLEGFAAAFSNPGSLGFSPGIAASAGVVLVSSHLAHEPSGQGGGMVELGVQLPVFDHPRYPIWMGMGLLTPLTGFYEIDLRPVEEPTYVSFHSRERRLSFATALGARVLPWLSVGAGVEMLPTVEALVSLDLANADGANRLDVDVGYRVTPSIGVAVRIRDDVKLGMSWRGQSHTDLRLPVAVDAEGIVLQAQILARTYFTPHRISVGAEWAFLKSLAVELAGSWLKFSSMPSPSASVALYDKAGEDTLGAVPPDPAMRDSVALSLSVRYRGPVDFSAGYGFVSSLMEHQSGRTNLLDSHRHTLAAGAKVPLYRQSRAPTSASVWASLSGTWLQPRWFYKDEILVGNPGYPFLEAGGFRVTGSLGLELTY